MFSMRSISRLVTGAAAAVILLAAVQAPQCEEILTIGRLKYSGGGDWYSNPSSLPNLLRFIHEETDIPTATDEEVVPLSAEELFRFPIVYMNGHGNVVFSASEAALLRKYLLGGGFLIADDNYGMDKSFRREMAKVFPDKDFVLLPVDHPIFSIHFKLPGGIPKIHEHDGEPAQAYALFHEGRMICFYAFQSDLGDGWEDTAVHKDPENLRRAALEMGTNIVLWTLTH